MLYRSLDASVPDDLGDDRETRIVAGVTSKAIGDSCTNPPSGRSSSVGNFNALSFLWRFALEPLPPSAMH